MAIARLVRAAETAELPTQMRPPTRVASIIKKRLLWLSIGLWYTPLSSMLAKRSSRFVTGTRVFSNQRRPLSTPRSPILCPESPVRTPSTGLPSAVRILTIIAWTPWLTPSTSNCAKTTAKRASRAAPPIHSFRADSLGVVITNSCVACS